MCGSKGNILYDSNGGTAPEVCIVDWQNYGLGHPAWELVYVGNKTSLSVCLGVSVSLSLSLSLSLIP